MFLVENNRAFFDRAYRHRVGELFELVRRQPGDILKAPQSSDAGCSNSTHLRNVADALVREHPDSRDKYSFDGFGYPCNRFTQAQLLLTAVVGVAHQNLVRPEFLRKSKRPRIA